MSDFHVFTSESVSEGHPDKIADQISDAVLDAILGKDPRARVACETFVKTGMVLVGGKSRLRLGLMSKPLPAKSLKILVMTARKWVSIGHPVRYCPR